MCGISGIFSEIGLPKEKLQKAVRAMDAHQKRRGPDDYGTFNSGPIFFGHHRLSILDLSKAGRQPMRWQKANSKERIVITFNGEIYNFLELKEDLERKKYKFKTRTDTEVVLALYEEYGERSFSMLRGMFAFGLWDAGQQKLFLVKDRYGIKPLYYYSDSKKLVFASTVGALEASGLVSKEKNQSSLIGFLLFGSVPLPMTTLKNVLAVPAGHYLMREIDGKQKLIRYYDPLKYYGHKPILSQRESAASKIRALLDEAINIHLLSDAPLGVFLSGGLDSSAIAAIAANQRKKPIVTLSIDFEEKDFSERQYQDLVAQKIGSDHHRIKISSQGFFESLKDVFEAMDQPTIDGVNTFFISKAAKEAGLKVVLSGLGGDEIFCGYPSFKRAALLRKIQSLPNALKKPIDFFAALGDRYGKLSYFKADDLMSFYLGIRGLFAPQEVAKILDINESEVDIFLNAPITNYQLPITDLYRTSEVQKLNPVDLLSYLELKFYLQNQLLKDTDFMSMYHSIEVRVPFLDHKLVEYVSSLPAELKIDNSLAPVNKPLLAKAVKDLLPPKILKRKKMGFTFPFEKWLKEGPPIPPKLTSILRTSEVQEFESGQLHWSRFWAMVVLKRFGL